MVLTFWLLILLYTLLYWLVLYCPVLYCTDLYCTVLTCTVSTAVSTAVTAVSTIGACWSETKDPQWHWGWRKRRRELAVKVFQVDKKTITETKMEEEEQRGTAGVDVWVGKSWTQEVKWKSDRKIQTERWEERKTGSVWTGRVQPAVFRSHAVCCLIRCTSTTNSL